jgi:cell wall assembly regulator SMI1
VARLDLAWDGTHQEIGDADVRKVEAELGVNLPADFAEYVKPHHGGSPDKSDFFYADPRIGQVNSCLAELLSFDLAYDDNIVTTRKDLGDQLPPGVVPFGATGFGDYVCFDFRRRPDSPSVVYWSHEKPIEESVIPLADSFTDFLDRLRAPEDEG